MFCSYENAACKKGDLEYVSYVPGHECMVVEEVCIIAWLAECTLR
jgi:hypothetical protein